mmetsp:Transcript_43179/g.70110  ORF Transcript_43179/g.70110 Transcript_43179/m.70110 type:complete len:104 (-) Transcript_43179:235-546(-)
MSSSGSNSSTSSYVTVSGSVSGSILYGKRVLPCADENQQASLPQERLSFSSECTLLVDLSDERGLANPQQHYDPSTSNPSPQQSQTKYRMTETKMNWSQLARH